MKKSIFLKNKAGKGGYDASILAGFILARYPNIRSEADYEGMLDWIIDRTMSCDKKEQIEWMKYYMIKAVEMDKKATHTDGMAGNAREGMRRDAALQFMAAYDLI